MFLGIDVGTTGVKAVLIDGDGRVAAEAGRSHDLRSPRPGWAEEDPRDWWQGTLAAASQVMAQRLGPVRALGVSGMVPALLLLDAQGHPLRPSIQQNDARAVDEIRECREGYAEDTLFARSGATWNQQVLPPKLLWVRRHEPEIWKRLHRLSGSYEYATFRLTGAVYAEANWALESGLWDAQDQTWNAEVLAVAGLPVSALAPVRRSHEVVGEVTDAAASAAGFPRGIPVVAGSADHIAAALAAGLRRSGDVVLKFGGAGDVLYVVDGFTPLRTLFIDYHDLPGLFVINGCMATSGSLVKWFRDRFRAGQDYQRLDGEAEAVPPGSDGLVVLPYFLGEKTPIHDPEARGTVLGLTLSHGPAHVYRAILEGVAYAFRHHIDVLEQGGHRVTRCYVMDGGARSPLWRRITASVLNRDVYFLEGGHAGGAYGVALIAGVASGQWGWNDLPVPAVAGVTPPVPAAVPRYQELYYVYRETYRRLKDLFPALGVRDG